MPYPSVHAERGPVVVFQEVISLSLSLDEEGQNVMMMQVLLPTLLHPLYLPVDIIIWDYHPTLVVVCIYIK